MQIRESIYPAQCKLSPKQVLVSPVALFDTPHFGRTETVPAYMQSLLRQLPSEGKPSFIDNHSGAHPEVLNALQLVNRRLSRYAIGMPAYGEDPITQMAVNLLHQHFCRDGWQGGSDRFSNKVDFVPTGTAANVIGLSEIVGDSEEVLCSRIAHIKVDESTAPQKFINCHIQDLKTTAEGKITAATLRRYLQERSRNGVGGYHQIMPKAVSITQPTEYGTVYTEQEIRDIAKVAHENGLMLHMDGARLSNAAASLNVPLHKITTDAGVDVLSFGLTKNGALSGNAILYLNSQVRGSNTDVIRGKSQRSKAKLAMSLVNKTWQMALQYYVLLNNNLYLRNAQQANKMASLLAHGLQDLPSVTLMLPVQTNAVFIQVPSAVSKSLGAKYNFYNWPWPGLKKDMVVMRLMTSFNTKPATVTKLLQDFKMAVTQSQ